MTKDEIEKLKNDAWENIAHQITERGSVCYTDAIEYVIDYLAERGINFGAGVGDGYDMVRLLLPLAKGYVHAHPGIRSTECIIEDAEAMLAAAPKHDGGENAG